MQFCAIVSGEWRSRARGTNARPAKWHCACNVVLAKGNIMNGCNEILEPAGIVSAAPVCWGSRGQFDPIRIWLVDDNSSFRSLIASLLNEGGDFECSREFSSPSGVLKALQHEPAPDIILLDIEMGAENGLDAIRPIKSLAKSTHVLMLTTFAR